MRFAFAFMCVEIYTACLPLQSIRYWCFWWILANLGMNKRHSKQYKILQVDTRWLLVTQHSHQVAYSCRNISFSKRLGQLSVCIARQPVGINWCFLMLSVKIADTWAWLRFCFLSNPGFPIKDLQDQPNVFNLHLFFLFFFFWWSIAKPLNFLYTCKFRTVKL